MAQQDNRREFRREYDPYTGKMKKKDAPEDQWVDITAINIGPGGLLFDFDRKLEMGDIIQFKIKGPETDEYIDFVGTVIREQETGRDDNLMRYAVEFIR